MKFFILLFTVSILLVGFTNCGFQKDKTQINEEQISTEENSAVEDYDKNTTDFPWNFPEDIVNEGMKEGQTVLSIHTFYQNRLAESKDPAEDTYIFYNGKLDKMGSPSSTVSGYEKIPNSVIVPITEGQTAKVGDIVLTWWQSGSGLQRAIVTDASDPTSPKVVYLDLDWKDDGSGFANEHANEQLKPNTFVVIDNNAWQPGAQVVIPDDDYRFGTLISCNDEKVLISGFAGKISVYYRDFCKLVPTKQDINVGDEVKAVWVSSFSDGYKVTKIDRKNGRVWVDNGNGEEVKSILEVIKDL